MNATTLAKAGTLIFCGLKKYAPEIMTGLGIVGMVGAAVAAVKATPKAIQLINEKKEELDTDTLSAKESVKASWKCYIPATALAVASAVCLVGACSIHIRRGAAIAAAYAFSESSLRQYKNQVAEQLGSEKAAEIREAAVKAQKQETQASQAAKNAAAESGEKSPFREVKIVDCGGSTEFYDCFSGRYFKSDKNKIDKAVNELNRRMRSEEEISLNDFNYEIGLPEVKYGDQLGWKIDHGYIDISYIPCDGSGDNPAYIVDYEITPICGFC